MNASGDALDELVEFILKINGGLKQGQDYTLFSIILIVHFLRHVSLLGIR